MAIMNIKIKQLMILLIVITLVFAQKIHFHSPVQLYQRYPSGIGIHLSPIGYHPKSGQLDGQLVFGEPFDACEPINNVQNQQDNVFVMVNDLKCLQSTKAENIVRSGAIVGLVKQNINNTFHDKENNIVHIPIVEIGALIFDDITNFIDQNPNAIVSLSLQFSSQSQQEQSANMNKIPTRLWLTPTQLSSYQFLLSMQQFLHNQQSLIEFIPKYVTHSQKERKRFIGCYSNGLYCPVEIQYDGRHEGQNVVEETLRQVVIRQLDIHKWWKYIQYYYQQCLLNIQEDVFMSDVQYKTCSQNAMILAGINVNQIQNKIKQSFVGSRKQIDDNILLNEQRQQFIRQKIQYYPSILINKNEYNLLNYDTNQIKIILCKNQHQTSQVCEQVINGRKFKKNHWFIIVSIIIIIIIFILIAYKIIVNRRMKKQMQSQVKSTLQQYYRYMETLEGQNNKSNNNIHDNRHKDKFNKKIIQQNNIQNNQIEMKESIKEKQ